METVTQIEQGILDNSQQTKALSDRLRKRALARVRKARQRQKQRSRQNKTITIILSPISSGALQQSALLVGDSVKGQAELLLRITAQRNFRDLVQLAKHAAELWPRVEPYVRYAAFLKSPGTHFRIRDQTLTFEEGGPLLDQLSELQATLSRRGYSARKAESFIRNAGNRLSRLREFPSPAPHRQTVP